MFFTASYGYKIWNAVNTRKENFYAWVPVLSVHAHTHKKMLCAEPELISQ